MEPRTVTFFDHVREPMQEVEARMRSAPAEPHPNLEMALDHLLASGGKRIRPTLSLLTASLLGADPQAAITLAAAIEMLHTATLVHDDLIDGSLLRRGIPTLNAQWSPGATVLTGDFIFARAAHLAAQTGSLEVIEGFSRTLMTIVNGEIGQLFGTHSGDSRSDYFDRIYAKTASLFELATEAAAKLAGSDPPIVESARSFGYSIGVAYQIVDDVIDFTGEQKRIGKPVGSDLRQGLITLPTLYYLADKGDGADPEQLLADVSRDPSALDRLVESIRQSDAVDQAMREATEFVENGRRELELLPPGAERDALHELASYVVQRSL